MNAPLSYVAFIDILGFGDMVADDCNRANPGTVHLPKLKSAINEIKSNVDEEKFKITQFSDSIVLSKTFVNSKGDFLEFLDISADLQRNLFCREILTRGGISHGTHFHDETLLFSQALIDSYTLESKLAVNPRVLISKDTIDLIFPNFDVPSRIVIDTDGLPFLHYLDGLDLDLVNSVLTSKKALLNSHNQSARGKIAWLHNYLCFAFPEAELPVEVKMRSA